MGETKKPGTAKPVSNPRLRQWRITRRELLCSMPVGVAAVGLSMTAGCKYHKELFLLSDPPVESDSPRPEWKGSQVKSHRVLGGTGVRMSDISFGCAALSDPSLVRLAVERGVNYFDTSPDYAKAGSETALGEGLRGFPRDKLFIASKLCTPRGHLENEARVDEVVAAVEASLKRLRTKYVDLLHIHACDSIDRLLAPNLHEAFDRLKRAGKARFLGVSSHTPNLEKVMRHAVGCGRFDVIMVAYNFKSWPALHEIFSLAREKRVGVVAMKTLKGAYHTVLSEFTPTERQSFTQAAFKWVLSNADVSGLVVSINNPSQLDEYLYASGSQVGVEDIALLERYEQCVSRLYCRPGCGSCLTRCPHGVPIDDVMRYAMYYESYGRRVEARALYAACGQAARICWRCPAPCEPACPFNLRVREQLIRADALLC